MSKMDITDVNHNEKTKYEKYKYYYIKNIQKNN